MTLPSGVVGVIRTTDPDHALTLGRGLLAAGVPGVEITMTVPDAPAVIAELAPGSDGRVGAGTVRTPDEVDACVGAGAAYIVAPGLELPVLERARALGVPMVPGALTPTEMTTAVAAGAAGVKVFPVGAVGGPGYLKAILEPLRELRIVASGGIEVEQIEQYLAAGAYSVCLGKALVDAAAVERGDVDGVRRYAKSVLGG
jgi:2-dehydro-3-deoxyphosphogluconate aldolase/(4S)-4-hydroxy-2-oxoglutarate aldolase